MNVWTYRGHNIERTPSSGMWITWTDAGKHGRLMADTREGMREIIRDAMGISYVGETVHTWADAFGIWHARVTFPGGYGPSHLGANIDRIRAKARRAIRREIVEREGKWHDPNLRGYRCAVHVVANDLDHMNLMHSITFAERNS